MRIIAAILFCAVGVHASDFTASTFFQVPVSEQGEVKPAAGVNLRGIFWHGFGLDLDLIQSAIQDDFIDRTAAHVVYLKTITGPLDAIAFAGPAWDAEDEEHGVEVGGGLEYRFGKGPVVSANLRWQKDDTDQHVIVPTVGAGWRF
jgi:hypothetical protein